jgi:hypothetical protein
MKKLFLLLAILIISVINLKADEKYSVNYKKQNNGHILQLVISDYSISTIEKSGQKFTKINFESSIYKNLKGFAQLPIIRVCP